MSEIYIKRYSTLITQINAQKAIYKFRTFLYLLNKDVRQHCFSLSYDFLNNELNNKELHFSERENLQSLLNHWQWSIFENTSTSWWSVLSYNHYKSTTLITLLHLWIDDIPLTDLDTDSLGIR